MKTKKRLHDGYTITEVIVVIVIIGILTAISVVGYGVVRNNAVNNSLMSDLRSAADQLVIDQTNDSGGNFPETLVAADGGNGVKWSNDATPTYIVNNSGTVKTFCLSATVNNQRYFTTQEGVIIPGPCPVLYLDAHFKKSYPGTGTTWYDLSGNANNAALTGGVTYDSSDGGSMVFDGTSGYGTVTNNSTLDFSSEQTILIVMKHTYTSGRKNPWDQAYGGYGTWTHENGVNINYFYGTAGVNNSPYTNLTSATTPTGVWNFMCTDRSVTTVKWYINGSLTRYANNPYGVLPSTAANIRIGTGYAGYWVGNMAMVMAFNKALTDSEVSKIYDTFRSRFGL